LNASSPSAKRRSTQFALAKLVHHRPKIAVGRKSTWRRWTTTAGIHPWMNSIAETVGRVLDSQGQQRIRAVLGDVDALEEAVDRLEIYERFHPDRFDRRKVNRRFKQYAQGDEEWRWEWRERR
ncbi:MAG: hypothetical protein WAM44_04775, partial [Chthoniobacterales bacterium]